MDVNLRNYFNIITFGCQMNVRDSHWLGGMLKEQGMIETSPDKADIIILNTCSVREKPEIKVKNALAGIKASGNDKALICICGCVAQQSGKKLFGYSPQIRLIAGTDALHDIPFALQSLLKGEADQIALLNFENEYFEKPLEKDNNHSVFVTIMQGCSNFCSYCIVPFTRGPEKSRRSVAILEECENRVASGAKEIILLGQNVNAWGKDLNIKGEDFSWLLYKIAALPGLKRLRFVTSHPKDLDIKTIKAFGNLENLCPGLALPLQSGSDAILKAMKRGYTSSQYLNLAENLKKYCPELALTTDLIVGFPGETEADFQQTLNVMQKAGFTGSFSFCYSDRPGTKASTMPGKLENGIKLERLVRLQALQEEMTEKYLKSRIGQKCDVLIDKRSSRGTGWQGKDSQGITINIMSETDAENLTATSPIGQILPVVITEAKRHTLIGKLDIT